MAAFDFVIPGPPVSQQTRRRERLREWKEFVRHAAEAVGTPPSWTAQDSVSLTIVYLYDEVASDVDNIVKPIQDALIGVALDDDLAVTDLICRRRSIHGRFDLTAVPLALAAAFDRGGEFLYVRIADAPQEMLL